MKKSIIIGLITAIMMNIFMPLAFAQEEENENEGQRYYQVLYNHVLRTSPSLGSEWANWIAQSILYFSSKYEIDPLLVAANFTIESGFRMSALSRTGAVGIAQLQPETAVTLGVTDITDPEQNVEGGIRYMADQINTFRNAGDWTASYAIAAYNAGPGAIKKYGGIPPYDETINHVISVGAVYKQLLNDLYYGG